MSSRSISWLSPADRYQKMAEMSRALDQCCRVASAVCPPPSLGLYLRTDLAMDLKDLALVPTSLVELLAASLSTTDSKVGLLGSITRNLKHNVFIFIQSPAGLIVPIFNFLLGMPCNPFFCFILPSSLSVTISFLGGAQLFFVCYSILLISFMKFRSRFLLCFTIKIILFSLS